MSSRSLLDQFPARTDPRQSWKVVYPLPDIVLTILCGTMAGADDFVEINLWADRKLDFLRRILPFKHGVPSHDTLNDVMNALPSALFSECFAAWVAGRATVTKPRSHTVSAWASRLRLVPGQEAVASKSNEIRRHKISHDVSSLTTDRRFPSEPRFPPLAMLGMPP